MKYKAGYWHCTQMYCIPVKVTLDISGSPIVHRAPRNIQGNPDSSGINIQDLDKMLMILSAIFNNYSNLQIFILISYRCVSEGFAGDEYAMVQKKLRQTPRCYLKQYNNVYPSVWCQVISLGHKWPLLLTWFNFNPSRDKLTQAQ